MKKRIEKLPVSTIIGSILSFCFIASVIVIGYSILVAAITNELTMYYECKEWQTSVYDVRFAVGNSSIHVESTVVKISGKTISVCSKISDICVVISKNKLV